jgi:hypothetical protein
VTLTSAAAGRANHIEGTLRDDKIALAGSAGSVQHTAHDFGVFANVSIRLRPVSGGDALSDGAEMNCWHPNRQ